LHSGLDMLMSVPINANKLLSK